MPKYWISESQNVLGGEGPQRSLSSKLPTVGRAVTHQHRLHRAPSNLAFNTSRDKSSTTFLENLFQQITTLWVKNIYVLKRILWSCTEDTMYNGSITLFSKKPVTTTSISIHNKAYNNSGLFFSSFPTFTLPWIEILHCAEFSNYRSLFFLCDTDIFLTKQLYFPFIPYSSSVS